MKNLEQAPLIIVTCGGTIDKRYDTGGGIRDLSFGELPATTTILRQAQSYLQYPSVPLMAKDSLDMSHNDRVTVAALCAALPHKRILVTHGTDTLHLTAEVIAKKKLKKTVVLTAASQPAVMRGSDADFNVGFALAAALLKKHGVYIAMNARVYNWDECKKNLTSGIFEPWDTKGTAKA